MEKVFKLKKNKTTVGTEMLAGLITFMTMAYILAVNPSILGAAGMDKTAVMLATCIASFIGCLCMGLMANLPFALSAGMGINAFMANTVCLGMGYTWQVALFAVFIEGIIFIILSLTNVREAIFNSIPLSLKYAVSVGIGIYIALIGMENAGLVGNGNTLLEMVDFDASFKTRGICALLAIIGFLIIAILHVRKIHGAIFIGILATWILGIICQLTGIYEPDNQQYFSLLPEISFTDFSALGKTAGKCFDLDFSNVKIMDYILVVFAFLFVDIFDTIGTLIGVSAKAEMLDKDGKLEKIKPALLADAVATTAGAVLGTSTTTTFIESASGVAAGGRTGLTAITTGVLFLVSMLLAPVFVSIPSFATASALIFVGFMMFTTITKIKLDDDNLTEAIPAYICIITMPLFYSISNGISMGVISYVLINVFCGKAKKINPILYVLSVLFILKYIFL